MIFISSCDDLPYKTISKKEVERLVVQDTVVFNKEILITSVGKSVSDPYTNLLLSFLQSDHSDQYLFNSDCRVENDSTIIAYSNAFLIDEDGEFRKNGIWVHTKFSTEGTFPFISSSMKFGVDSVPNYYLKLPTKEGIYFYENDSLILFSQEQSEYQWRQQRKDGFYFIPNKGRFFDRIYIKDLE